MTALPEADRNRVPELDGCRGLAILLVLVWHYLICEIGAPPPLFRPLNQTWSGVDLFFVLSGFLIGGILLDNREASNYFAVFYGRRACRILPVYYAWLLLFALLQLLPLVALLGSAAPWLFGSPLPWWSYPTFTQNFVQAARGDFGANWLGITWSLAIEEQFYLALPLIIRFTPRRVLPYLFGAVIIAAPIARTLLFDPKSLVTAYVIPLCRADSLLLGALCAWFVRQPNASRRLTEAMPLIRTILIAGLLFIILTSYPADTPLISVSRYSVLAITYAALILQAVYAPQSMAARLARVGWLRRLGIVAYGTYLVHQGVSGMVYGLARRHWPYIQRGADLLLIVISLMLTIALANASWRWFEKPLVRFGHRLHYVRPRFVPEGATTLRA